MPLILVCYLAGVLSLAALVFLSGGATPLLMFLTGVSTAVLGLAAILSSPRRLRRAARLLAAIAQVFDRHHPTTKRPMAPDPPRPKSVSDSPSAELIADVSSSLTNWGARKKDAAAAARMAAEGNPEADFDTVLRTALTLLPATPPATRPPRPVSIH